MDPAAKAKLDTLESRQAELANYLIQLQQQHQMIEQSIEQFKHDSVHSEEVQTPTVSEKVQAQPIAEEVFQEIRHTTPPPVTVVAQPTEASVPVEPAQPLVTPEVHTPPVIPNKIAVYNPNWEINFGQTWLVRIGVLSLLTGLIFLSTYAYQNWLFGAPEVIL